MRKRGAALLLMSLMTVVGVSTAQTNLPVGWRVPRAEEISLPNDTWRNSSREKYLVVMGDFDGDGREDQARLLVSADGAKYALFVFLGSGASLRLDYQDANSLKTMGIDRVSPGTHKTACGKGYGDCKTGEPESLQLRNPGILYFQSESAASVYFWSVPDRAFRRVWLSD